MLLLLLFEAQIPKSESAASSVGADNYWPDCHWTLSGPDLGLMCARAAESRMDAH